MRKRGVTDFSLAMVDPWSAGNFGLRRATRAAGSSRALTWVRRTPDDNGYARPVDNLVTVVDLNAMKVLAVEDDGVVPLPPEDANYSPEVGRARAPDLKPLEIRQPEGPSFELDGHELAWQKWRMRDRLHAARGAGAPHRHATRTRAASARSSTAPPSPTWWCRTAIRGRPTSTATPSTSASTASARWPTRSRSAATASGEIRYFDARGQRQPGPRRDAPERHLHARGGRRHPLEAHRLAHWRHARCAARAGWSSRSSPPWATTSTASTGTSTRTAPSSSR